MDKRFWGIIIAIIVVFSGIVLLSHRNSNGTNSSNVQPSNHLTGKLDSKVKLIEYGDYQCPPCALYEPIVEQVIAKYSDKITFQFRNLPISQIHQNAFAAARAAEAASDQNKFWEMHNLIYKNQDNWKDSNNAGSIFEGYATELGLNLTQFKTDFASSATNDRVNADLNEFDKTGFEKATPTFILNGKKITPDPTLDSFSKILDQALQQTK